MTETRDELWHKEAGFGREILFSCKDVFVSDEGVGMRAEKTFE